MNGSSSGFFISLRVELAQKRYGNEKSINALQRIGILVAVVVFEGSRSNPIVSERDHEVIPVRQRIGIL